MNGNLLIVILPLIALIVAGLSIAGLWYWWVTTKDEDEAATLAEDDRPPVEEDAELSIEEQLAGLDEEPQGSFFARLVESLKPLPTPPTSPADSPPPHVSTYTAPVPKPEMPPANAERPIAPRRSLGGNTVEVMRLLRDLADGSLVVEINGRYYYHLEDITDPEVGRRFNGIVQALAEFVEPGDFEMPEEWLTPPTEPIRATGDEVLPPTDWQTAHSTPQSQTRKVGFFQRGRQAGEEPLPEVRPMTEQIEELLQYRLTATPEFSNRSIHVRPAADGSVRIEVDGRFYEGVGAVDDPEIQEFLRETIRQWEARQ